MNNHSDRAPMVVIRCRITTPWLIISASIRNMANATIGINMTSRVRKTPFSVRPIKCGDAVNQWGGVVMVPVSLCSFSLLRMGAEASDNVAMASTTSAMMLISVIMYS